MSLPVQVALFVLLFGLWSWAMLWIGYKSHRWLRERDRARRRTHY